VEAYLGEKVVKEKEYLSAIVSVDLGIYSRIIPRKERCEWRLWNFAESRDAERLSCCRCCVEVQ